MAAMGPMSLGQEGSLSGRAGLKDRSSADVEETGPLTNHISVCDLAIPPSGTPRADASATRYHEMPLCSESVSRGREGEHVHAFFLLRLTSWQRTLPHGTCRSLPHGVFRQRTGGRGPPWRDAPKRPLYGRACDARMPHAWRNRLTDRWAAESEPWPLLSLQPCFLLRRPSAGRPRSEWIPAAVCKCCRRAWPRWAATCGSCGGDRKARVASAALFGRLHVLCVG